MSHEMERLHHPGSRDLGFWWCSKCGALREVTIRSAADLSKDGFGVPNTWGYRWRRPGGQWAKWRKVVTNIGAIMAEAGEVEPDCERAP